MTDFILVSSSSELLQLLSGGGFAGTPGGGAEVVSQTLQRPFDMQAQRLSVQAFGKGMNLSSAAAGKL